MRQSNAKEHPLKQKSYVIVSAGLNMNLHNTASGIVISRDFKKGHEISVTFIHCKYLQTLFVNIVSILLENILLNNLAIARPLIGHPKISMKNRNS